MGFPWPAWLTPKAWRPADASGPIQGAPAPPERVTGSSAQPGAAPAWWTEGIPPECHEMSAAFEGFRASPYRDSAGIWTIGIGSTRDAAGRPVTADTPPVTRAQAEEMARRDLTRAEMVVRQACPAGLPIRWAAVCILLANNMGDLKLKAPTLIKLLRAGEWKAAAEALKLYRNSGGQPVLGLRRRRWVEAAYAMGMSMPEAHRRAWDEISSAEGWPPLPE